MCLLAIFFRSIPDCPVLVGANREESYVRVGEKPRLIEGPIRFAAGIDPVAGGTWLGVNAQGVIIGVTNRPKSTMPANPRSRGLLVRDLLSCPTAAEAVKLATHALSTHSYAGCNLLCVDKKDALVLHAGDWLRVRPLPPGLHVLTAHDVNEEHDRRTDFALKWLASQPHNRADDWIVALKELCGQTGDGNPPICLRGSQGGTVSSSIIALCEPKENSRYWHAQGPPDVTHYDDYSDLLRQLPLEI